MLALALLMTIPGAGVEVVADGAAPQVVVMRLEAAGGVAPGDVETLDGRLLRTLAERTDIEVIDPRDLERFIALEAERDAAGVKCDDDSCIAEVADALGAGRILYGRVGRLGQQFSLQLSLFDAVQGRSIARTERSSLLIEVIGGQALQEAVNELLGPPADAAPPALPPEVRPGGHALFWTGVTLATVGALGVVGFGGGAAASELHLADPAATDKDFARDTGWLLAAGAGLSAALLGAGGLLVVVGATE